MKGSQREKKKLAYQVFNDKLKKYSSERKANSIEALLGKVVDTRHGKGYTAGKFTYENKTKEQIQSHLKSLFSRNQAATKETELMQRQVNLKLQDRPLQRRLMKGLSIRSGNSPVNSPKQSNPDISDQQPSQHITLAVVKPSPRLIKPFSLVAGQFSQWGPARSVATITAKTLYKNVNKFFKIKKKRVQSNQPSPTRLQVRQEVKETLRSISNSPKRDIKSSYLFKVIQKPKGSDLYQQNKVSKYEQSSQINGILTNLTKINIHNIQKSHVFQMGTYTERDQKQSYLESRVQSSRVLIGSQDARVTKQKFRRGGQTLIQSLGENTNSNQQFSSKHLKNLISNNPFNNPSDLQVYLNQWNPIQEFERQDFKNFLYNRWITTVLEKRSLQADYDRKENALILKINQELAQKSNVYEKYQDLKVRMASQDYRNNIKIDIPNSFLSSTLTKRSLYSNFRPPIKKIDQEKQAIQSLHQYMSSKQKQYKSSGEVLSQQLVEYDNQEWYLIKQKDEDNLVDFDNFYERKVKLRRAKQKLKFYLVKIYRLQVPFDMVCDCYCFNYKIISFIQSHSYSSYQKVGSFAFIQQLKSENYNQCDKLLEKNKMLINDFNYLGEVPLHIAVRRNNQRTLQYILSKSPDLESVNFQGLTPLKLSCLLGHQEITKILLLSSANPWRGVYKERQIKIACLCWIKIKCKQLYWDKEMEDEDHYNTRIFNEMQFYLISSRAQSYPLSDIYRDLNKKKPFLY